MTKRIYRAFCLAKETCRNAMLAGAPLLASLRMPACILRHSLALALTAPELFGQYPLPGELMKAEAEVARLKELVSIGAVAPVKVREAEAVLEDARDHTVLGRLLYGKLAMEDLRPQDTADMVGAATRRVERQRERITKAKRLLDAGVSARSEMEPVELELNARLQVLDLANKRVKLIAELTEMAQAESRLAMERLVPGAIGPDMEYYPGKGRFNETDLKAISGAFEKQFGRALPVSAKGETAVHKAMGYDHRGRVDVGLNPDAPEGLWLRSYLSKAEIPYVAFRRAMAGSATAPHIHMGMPSPRVNLAESN